MTAQDRGAGRRGEDDGLEPRRGEDRMLERQATVQRVDDVARVVRESARDAERVEIGRWLVPRLLGRQHEPRLLSHRLGADAGVADRAQIPHEAPIGDALPTERIADRDRKSTRLNSSHGYISYAVFCLKK